MDNNEAKWCPFGVSHEAHISKNLAGREDVSGGGHMTPCIEDKCALWVPYSDSGACTYYLQGQAAVLSLEALAKMARPMQTVNTVNEAPADPFKCSQCGEIYMNANKAPGTDVCIVCEEEVGIKDLDDGDPERG